MLRGQSISVGLIPQAADSSEIAAVHQQGQGQLGMMIEETKQLAGWATRLDKSTLVLIEGVFANL
ncbi:hypothetical protein N182_10720 [Sinorhizobium sp. GL2]|nr:hypothetical protein N182_10720 [Sinorhizobium sp. GL2]